MASLVSGLVQLLQSAAVVSRVWACGVPALSVCCHPCSKWGFSSASACDALGQAVAFFYLSIILYNPLECQQGTVSQAFQV